MLYITLRYNTYKIINTCYLLSMVFFVKAINCRKLLAPQNGTMFGKETTYPNSMRFSCDEGFILSGSWLRKCQTNGTWSGNETKCQGLIILASFTFYCHTYFVKQLYAISRTQIENCCCWWCYFDYSETCIERSHQ